MVPARNLNYRILHSTYIISTQKIHDRHILSNINTAFPELNLIHVNM